MYVAGNNFGRLLFFAMFHNTVGLQVVFPLSPVRTQGTLEGGILAALDLQVARQVALVLVGGATLGAEERQSCRTEHTVTYPATHW